MDSAYDVATIERANDSTKTVAMECAHGIVQLGGLDGQWTEMRAFRRLWTETSVTIEGFAQALDKTQWSFVYAEVLLKLGAVVESTLLAGNTDSMLPTMSGDGASGRKPAVLKHLKFVAKALHKKRVQQLRTRICKYFFAGRRMFASIKNGSFTCDASRIGK